MIFKVIFLCFVVLAIPFAENTQAHGPATANNESTKLVSGKPSESLLPFVRPLTLRSDALSKANYVKLRGFARMGYNPRTGVEYDWRGFPKFKSNYDVQLKPSEYRRSDYGKICNKQLLDEIRKNPKLRSEFTSQDIELLKKEKNPKGKNWHHDPQQKGRMQLVDAGEHSTDHVGGDKVWGRIDQRAFNKATAVRWGSVAVFDFAFSSVGLLYTGEFDFDHFAQVSTRSFAGGSAAFSTECLFVRFMPKTVGMPPGWFGGLRLLYGGPAVWASSISYATARAIVDYCWDSYRLTQLQIQEEACRLAEMKARWQKIEYKAKKNSQSLRQLNDILLQYKGNY